MKTCLQNAVKGTQSAAKQRTRVSGPSLYEKEYLNQLAEELKIFLKSKNVTTVKDIYLGFQGGNYRGQMLLSKGA